MNILGNYSQSTVSLSIMQNLSIISIIPVLTGFYGGLELEEHVKNVSKISLALSQELNLNLEDQRKVYLGALLHDIGKLLIPRNILLKPDKLDPYERKIIESHTIKGDELTKKLSFNKIFKMSNYARSHHELLNGKGYPDKKTKEKIPFGIRILAVADKYEALSSKRTYKEAIPDETVLSILKDLAYYREEIDNDVYNALLKWINKGKPEPNYEIINPKIEIQSEKLFNKYRNEIINFISKLIHSVENGYNTKKIQLITNKFSECINLPDEQKNLLELASIFCGIGALTYDKKDQNLRPKEQKELNNWLIKHRKMVVENNSRLLKITPWLKDLIPINQYLYAYYNGDPELSVYGEDAKPVYGKDIPELARMLTVIVCVFVVSNQPNRSVESVLRNLRNTMLDPDYVDAMLNLLPKIKNILKM